MDKRTLELLHSKLSDLDSKISEISSLRQQIFDILKDHEKKQDAAAAAVVTEPSEQDTSRSDQGQNSNDAEEQLDLSQIQAKVDEAVEEDQAEKDQDAIDAISDIDSPEDITLEAKKAKEDIAREAINLEAHKLMDSAPDDVEPMRKAEESLQEDINGENNQGTEPIEMVNNPDTMDVFDPTIIPQKELDEDLDVGKDSDLAKVNDAFAEMDRIESQEDIDRMDQELSQEHDHSDLVSHKEDSISKDDSAPREDSATKNDSSNEDQLSQLADLAWEEVPEVEVEEKAETFNEELSQTEQPNQTQKPAPEENKEEPEAPVKSEVEDQTKIKEADKVEEDQPRGYAPKNPFHEAYDQIPSAETIEEEAVVVQPRPLQQTQTQLPTHPSNQGTLNAGRPSTGMKVDEMLSRQNSRNLYKAFTLNDKFRFRRELFHGNDVEMAQALDRISLMDNYNQAEDYFYETLGLNPNNEDVKDFMLIIQNHFLN